MAIKKDKVDESVVKIPKTVKVNLEKLRSLAGSDQTDNSTVDFLESIANTMNSHEALSLVVDENLPEEIKENFVKFAPYYLGRYVIPCAKKTNRDWAYYGEDDNGPIYKYVDAGPDEPNVNLADLEWYLGEYDVFGQPILEQVLFTTADPDFNKDLMAKHNIHPMLRFLQDQMVEYSKRADHIEALEIMRSIEMKFRLALPAIRERIAAVEAAA